MKNNWQIKKLDDVCDFENGDRGSNYPSKSFRTVSGIPFINAGHLKDEDIDFCEMDYIPRERYDLLGNGKIKRNDILFCLRGSLGKFACVGELNEGAIASSLVILRTRDGLELKYLLAYLGSQLCVDMIRKYSNGAAQPNLSATSLKKFTIPFPPLPEQKRIAMVLDEVFEGVAKAKANAEKNLANARELFESYLQEIFNKPQITQIKKGWKKKKLGEVCEELSAGGDVPENNFSKIKTDKFNIPIFANGITDKGLYGYTDIARVTKPSVTISARGTIGYTEIRKESFYPIVRLIVLVPNKDLIGLSFFKYAASSIDFSNTGVSIPQLTVPMVREYEIPLPPLLEQESIVAKLDALSDQTKKLEAIYQQKLADFEELKKSVLQKAFNGEL